MLVSRRPQDTPPILEAVINALMILKRHVRRLRYLAGVSNNMHNFITFLSALSFLIVLG